MTIGQEIKSETVYGLRIDVTIQQIKEDKPLIYTYTYMLNTLKFKEWLESIPHLLEGPFAFMARGIQVMVVGGAEKWDKSAFSIANGDDEKVFLPLNSQEIRFTVHRDLFSGQEWDVLMEESQIAAQTI